MTTLDEIRARIEAAPTSSAGDPPWLADAKALLAVIDGLQWQLIETAPRDRVILAWCAHAADPCIVDGRLTTYAAHVEYFSHCGDGCQVLIWGGEVDDAEAGYIPNWWFVNDGNFETPANPTHWMPLPTPPAGGLK